MYLKSIKAHGFKSFADKINIEMQPGITAIVGPNGSGKSNIVDAIRWVLGCQSIKDLRGTDTMKDVIFTGSESRKLQNRASVALVFDNSDNYLKSDFNEVEVKRVVYKSGENEYFINNVKVRLKDITNLFLDTGIGNDSFNIISQGSVSDIINSKPEMRRSIFEEAAQTIKYKKRKAESLRKLEKTNDNILKIDLLVNELNQTIESLKEQSKKAQEYLTLKENLENQEIALMQYDITNINQQLQTTKEQIDILKEEELTLSKENTVDTSKIELLKLKNLKLEEEINYQNNQLLTLTEKLASIASEKQIALERQKYQVDKDVMNNELISLKEEELTIKKQIEILNNDLISLKEDLNKNNKKYQEVNEQFIKETNNKIALTNKINQADKDILNLQNQQEILKNNLNNQNRLPYAVSNILNAKIDGVHNTIGNLISYEQDYQKALNVAMSSSTNFIVVDNETIAANCINYLKNHKLGRATFFPLNIIKPKNIDLETLKLIENDSEFIALASDIVKYKEPYANIIKNQLGNIIVVKSLDGLNKIGRLINYKYRIVSLDGDIIHVGGSITGGSDYKFNKEKEQLAKITTQLEKIIQENEHYNQEYTKTTIKLNELNLEQINLDKIIIQLKESIAIKEKQVLELETTYKQKINEINGINDLKNNKIDEKVLILLEQYNKTSSEKEILEKNINKLKDEKFDLNNQLEEAENSSRQYGSKYNKLLNDLKQKEILQNKYSLQLENLLNILNEEYNMTYEKAANDYPLETDEKIARQNVTQMKKNLLALGEVNTGAISEYERLNTRYTFLNEQKNDLTKAHDELIEIIDEMDQIMITKFSDTFNKISEEFQTVFKTLFKGGHGILKLTNPDDILNTGIEIIAQPPGKKLNNIGLLSGGEKTLTAIALLFAILNIKTVPFCVLDEIEAALDEANVEQFCQYLNAKKNKSQFILITHKKQTMEYADVLYGITMQESGVSKIVSVKLENI